MSLSSLLETRPQRRRACRIAVGTLFLGNFVLHMPISDVADRLLWQLGFATFNRNMLLALGGGSVLVAVALLLRIPRHWLTGRLIAALVVLAVLSAASQQWLLVSNVEIVHLPQFALFAALLLGSGLAWPTAWLGATLAGVADEFYQYFVIYAGRPDVYLDYNDMLLNGIGAAWTILLLVRPSPPRRPVRRLTSAHGKAILLLVLMLAVGFWLDPPQCTPLLRRAATGRMYRVLSLPEAVLLVALLWGLLRAALSAEPARR